MHRRQFIKTAAVAAGAAAAPGFLTSLRAHAQTDQSGAILPAGNERKGDMLYRTLGRTGERVSAIGLGGYHIGGQRDEADSIKIIRTAIDAGITFMDNCWDYHNGGSERRMGKALTDGYRDKVFLMSKIDGRTKDAAARQIDDSLRRLHTDRLDLMQHHEMLRMEDADRIFDDAGAQEAMLAAQRAGKVRYIGFTGHKDPLVHLRTLDVAEQRGFRFDAVQMPLNVMDAHFRSFARQVVPRLVVDGIGVLGMKSMANGMILQTKVVQPAECLQYALSLPTSVVITGIDSMEVLHQALAVIKDFNPLSSAQMAALLDRTKQLAMSGKYEQFKTTTYFDGTARHLEWMG